MQLEVNESSLYVERLGSGEPLVLVHGGAGDLRYWDAQFKALAKEYDVVRYDLRGYGRSARPEEGNAYRHEDDLYALLNALELSPAHVAGYSLGCQVVIDAYTLYPELFRSILAVGPFVSGHATDATNALFGPYIECGEFYRADGPLAAAQRFVSIPAFNPQQIDSQVQSRLLEICGDYDWWWATHEDPLQSVSPPANTRLSQIGVPLLIVTGEYDAEVCREVALLLKDQVPRARFVDLPGASHFMLMEQPEAFNNALLQFLKSLG